MITRKERFSLIPFSPYNVYHWLQRNDCKANTKLHTILFHHMPATTFVISSHTLVIRTNQSVLESLNTSSQGKKNIKRQIMTAKWLYLDRSTSGFGQRQQCCIPFPAIISVPSLLQPSARKTGQISTDTRHGACDRLLWPVPVCFTSSAPSCRLYLQLVPFASLSFPRR